MSGYTKLFSSMLDSTVWMLSKEARLLWIVMLVKKNRAQVVEASVPGLANAARLTLDETLKALDELLAPDPYSRTRDLDGRRLLEVDGGWKVVNGEKYRMMLSKEERKEYQRAWQAAKRDAAKKVRQAASEQGRLDVVGAAIDAVVANEEPTGTFYER